MSCTEIFRSRIVAFVFALSLCLGFAMIGATSAYADEQQSIIPQEQELIAQEEKVVADPPALSGVAHVQNDGDVAATSDNGILTLGSTGQSKRLEAITIQTTDPSVQLEYRSHVQNIGWEENYTSQTSGTSGRALRVEAIEVRVAGDAAQDYDVHYRAHVQNIGWMDWAKNGEQVGSAGYALRMEALQVMLTKKDVAPPAPFPSNDVDMAYKCKRIDINTHVQNIGWRSDADEGTTAGTTGRALRLEAFSLSLQNLKCEGGIEYQAHVQNIGWQNWVANGQIAGTTGKGLRIEAICVQLTGQAKDLYDVYYCTHVEQNGWMDWAKNGERAGTASGALRMEAFRIVLVDKGGAAPGETKLPYLDPDAAVISYSAWNRDGGPMTGTSGDIVGTTGQSNPLTAMSAQYASGMQFSVSYQTHLGGIGWIDTVSDGVVSGYMNPSNSIEAIKISITGEAAEYFDIYYRVHARNIGWMGWARNGEGAGSTGMGRAVEAYQVKLVMKASSAPGSRARHFLDGERIAAIRASLDISSNYHNSQFVHGDKGADYQKYIVLHDTEGSGDADSVIDWWAGNGNMVSSHFVINRDGSIVQCVDMDKIAHHAGYGNAGNNAYYGIREDGRDDMRGTQSIGSYCPDYAMNAWSIGIEMVHVGGQNYPKAQLRALDGLIALIDASYGFESTIIQHSDWREGNSDCDGNFQGYLRNYQRYRTHDGSTYNP